MVQEDENMVMKAIREVGVNVDKEELIKALQYDRNQYTKGYEDGKNEVFDKIRAEIENMQIVYDKSANYKDERTDEEKANDLGKMYKVLVLSIIDKYRAESEGKE